jgi:hypothetical protein
MVTVLAFEMELDGHDFYSLFQSHSIHRVASSGLNSVAQMSVDDFGLIHSNDVQEVWGMKKRRKSKESSSSDEGGPDDAAGPRRILPRRTSMSGEELPARTVLQEVSRKSQNRGKKRKSQNKSGTSHNKTRTSQNKSIDPEKRQSLQTSEKRKSGIFFEKSGKLQKVDSPHRTGKVVEKSSSSQKKSLSKNSNSGVVSQGMLSQGGDAEGGKPGNKPGDKQDVEANKMHHHHHHHHHHQLDENGNLKSRGEKDVPGSV